MMKELLERIKKILEYDIKASEKVVYERDAKEIIEMIENFKSEVKWNEIRIFYKLLLFCERWQ